MKGYFTYCESLTSLDLSSLNTSICVKVWNTSRVENMNGCFAGCTFLAYHSLNALKRLSMNYLMLTGGHKKGDKETDEDEVWWRRV